MPAAAPALSAQTSDDVAIVREETSAAIAEYNELARSGRRAAALIHSTC